MVLFSHGKRRLLISLMSCLASASAFAVENVSSCSYESTETLSIKLTGKPPQPLNAYQTNISIGGSPSHLVTVDTGSVGIVVPQSAVPADLFNKSTQTDQILYTSSGDYLTGKTVTAPVTFEGSTPSPSTASTTTAPIDVLAVSCGCQAVPSASYQANSKTNCDNLNGTNPIVGGKPDTKSKLQNCHAVTDMGMMGVGFGRNNGATLNNPFLRLADMDSGKMHRGYVFTQTGITLGLTGSDTQGFKTTQLPVFKPTPLVPVSAVVPAGWKDWAEAQVTVSLGNPVVKPTMTGQLLVDTGIDYMFLTFPTAGRPSSLVQQTHQKFDGSVRQIVPPKTPVNVQVLANPGKNPIPLTYNFAAAPEPAPTAAPSPAGGSVVVWAGATGTSKAVNTGRHLLYFANYMFDAQCGLLGFQNNSSKTH